MSGDSQPATLAQRLHLYGRATACILAGVPSTTLIPLPLTQLLTRRFRREEQLKRLHKMVEWARFCVRHILGARVDVRGQENLPRPSRGHLYVSNHQSYADILVLMDALDTVAFLSKGMIRHFPVMGRCAHAGGTVFLKRSNPGDRQKALEETLKMCHQSTAVVVFPEGTRAEDEELRAKTHPRAVQEAWRHGLKVVPIAIAGTRRIVPKAMDRIGIGQEIAVRIGRPLDPADFDSAESYFHACWGIVATLFAEAKTAAGTPGD